MLWRNDSDLTRRIGLGRNVFETRATISGSMPPTPRRPGWETPLQCKGQKVSEIADAAAGVHCRAWDRGGVAGRGAGAAGGGAGDTREASNRVIVGRLVFLIFLLEVLR
jgi:hypothetical protein